MAQDALGSGLYDFDANDFGVQPDYDKEFLNGKVVVVHGVSEATFEGDFQRPARSLLHNLPIDYTKELAPNGCLMSEDSPAIRQTLDMVQKGKVPFVARLMLRDSARHKGQSYWTMEKVPPLQYGPDGFLIDPNEYPKADEGKKGK